ncbi:hypothetical protein KEM48_014208 [Puccinia striiformis f. sp. tritici PST-130]|nr:hypothetical protein KEM48_014208 [Puccinia striiformis f. sp. tritici PST-130]
MSPSNSPLTLTQITSPAPQEGCLDPVLLKITEELLEAHQTQSIHKEEHQEHKDLENQKKIENEDNESDEDNENEEEEDKDSTEKDADETYEELKRDIMIDSCVNILEQIEEADTEIEIDEPSENTKEINAPKKTEQKLKISYKKMKNLKKKTGNLKKNVPKKKIVVEPEDGDSEMDDSISLSSFVMNFDEENYDKIDPKTGDRLYTFPCPPDTYFADVDE